MRAIARGLSTTAKKAIEERGASLADIIADNPGEAGKKAAEAARLFKEKAKATYGERAAYIIIQGTHLHTSTKDPEETQKVVAMSIHTAKGTRLMSGHARDDGTFSERVTRAGGAKK